MGQLFFLVLSVFLLFFGTSLLFCVKKWLPHNSGISAAKRILLAVGFFLVSVFVGCAGLVLLRLVTVSTYDFFVMRGDSMEPTYSHGDMLFVNKRGQAYKHGDAIVFRTAQQYLVKRIVGVPGDVIEVDGQGVPGVVLFGDNDEQDSAGQVTKLGAKEFYIMGDNPHSSADSRIFGPILEGNIKGRVVFSLF